MMDKQKFKQKRNLIDILSLLNLMRRDLLKQNDKISDTTLKRLI